MNVIQTYQSVMEYQRRLQLEIYPYYVVFVKIEHRVDIMVYFLVK
jgi:hypothetical protein